MDPETLDKEFPQQLHAALKSFDEYLKIGRDELSQKYRQQLETEIRTHYGSIKRTYEQTWQVNVLKSPNNLRTLKRFKFLHELGKDDFSN